MIERAVSLDKCADYYNELGYQQFLKVCLILPCYIRMCMQSLRCLIANVKLAVIPVVKQWCGCACVVWLCGVVVL